MLPKFRDVLEIMVCRGETGVGDGERSIEKKKVVNGGTSRNLNGQYTDGVSELYMISYKDF